MSRRLSEEDAKLLVQSMNARLYAGHFSLTQMKAQEAEARKITVRALEYQLARARDWYGLEVEGERPFVDTMEEPDFEGAPLPSEQPTTEELLERRKAEFARRDLAERARQLVPVKVRLDGPIGIVHFGDPHVDDPGCDIGSIERHLELIRATPGLLGANVGDLSNNWVGRLARLYGDQSTSAAEAWILVEWLVGAIPWLYLVMGNHDIWSGAGNPINWMAKKAGVEGNWGARLNLEFPNGKAVRVNCRHDFSGHSMWNPVHGAGKAIQMGWRDHILVCGHKHESGYMILKDPSTGLISHALRVAGYKVHDSYAKALGLPNQNISPAAVTIIDPSRADDSPGLITTIHDVEMGADFLTFLRRRK